MQPNRGGGISNSVMEYFLAFISLVKSLFQDIRQNKRRVKVTCVFYSYVGPYYEMGVNVKTGKSFHKSEKKRSEGAIIRVICKGPRQVVIDKCGFQINRGRKKISPIHSYPYELPKKLTDGEFVEVNYSLGALKQELAKQTKKGYPVKLTHAIVSESDGKIHKIKIPEKLKLATQN